MFFGMQKKEIRALVILIATAAIVGTGWLTWKNTSDAEIEHKKDINAEFQKANTQTYEQGDTIVCDSRADEDMADGSGQSYSAGFDWNGTMNWTVVDSFLYDNPADAGISEDSEGTFLPMPTSIAESGDYRFLLCEVSIENVDAEPTDDIKPPFNIATFRTGTVGYFDGTIEGAAEKDGWKYDLPIGTTAVYHVGFYILNPDDNPKVLSASIGNASTDIKKIQVHLEPHDLRADAK